MAAHYCLKGKISLMTLQLLSGKVEEVSKLKYQYQFNIGENDIILTSKIENCVNQDDCITVVGYYFTDDCENKILGVVSYHNHTNQAKSDCKIPLYIFVGSVLLNVFFIFYSFNLYLKEIINYQIILFIFILAVVNYLGYFSTHAHLMLQSYLKKNVLSQDLKSDVFVDNIVKH